VIKKQQFFLFWELEFMFKFLQCIPADCFQSLRNFWWREKRVVQLGFTVHASASMLGGWDYTMDDKSQSFIRWNSHCCQVLARLSG
jgi:hypothetical protein